MKDPSVIKLIVALSYSLLAIIILMIGLGLGILT